MQPNKCFPAWMTDDCLELRTEYYRLLNISTENTDDENSRKDMVYMRSKYRNYRTILRYFFSSSCAIYNRCAIYDHWLICLTCLILNCERSVVLSSRWRRYNAKVRQCKSDYDKQFTDKLKNSMASNSKEFWKLLRPQKQNNNSVISPNDFFEYFRKLSNPDNVDYIVDDALYEYMRQYNNGILQTQYNELNNSISDAEVQKAKKRAQNWKSFWWWYAYKWIIYMGVVSLLPKLTALFIII